VGYVVSSLRGLDSHIYPWAIVTNRRFEIGNVVVVSVEGKPFNTEGGESVE
jgi:hypothetical protein